MTEPTGDGRKVRLLVSVLWPSFAVAVASCGLFFSAFNPDELNPFHLDHELSDLAIYSIGFFVFWAITALSSLGSWYFTVSNMSLSDPTERPDS